MTAIKKDLNVGLDPFIINTGIEFKWLSGTLILDKQNHFLKVRVVDAITGLLDFGCIIDPFDGELCLVELSFPQ